jgi:exosortase
MISESLARKHVLTMGLLATCFFVALYGFVPYTHSHLMHLTSVFGALWTMWTHYPDFGHGMLVPILSGVAIYTRRRELAKIPVTGWWPGVIAVAVSLGIFWAGRRVDNQYVGFLSIQCLFASLVLWLLGWRWLKSLALPLAFLAFAWPMPFLNNMVTFPLRLVMTHASVATLQLFGVDAIQQGTAIISAPRPELNLPAGGSFAVDVADPCSGIRSLFALMMVSALYGFFILKTGWQRAILFLASIPLAVAGNLVRILFLTLGTIILGSDIAIGTLESPTLFHMLAGYVVFIIALGGMISLGTALNLRRADIHRLVRKIKSFTKDTPPPRPLSLEDERRGHPSRSDIY